MIVNRRWILSFWVKLIIAGHNDHVLPQENNFVVTAKWPWIVHITCLSIYTSGVTPFGKNCRRLQKRYTRNYRRHNDGRLTTRYRSYDTYKVVFLLQQLPSTISFVMALTISQVIFFWGRTVIVPKTDIRWPAFAEILVYWQMHKPYPPLYEYTFKHIIFTQIGTNLFLLKQCKVLPEWGRFPDALTCSSR